jgi:hypothetical protein
MSEPDISSSAIDTPVTVIPGTGASAASEYRSSGSLCDTTVLLCHRAVTVHGGGILRNGMRILQSFGMDEGNNFLTGDYTTKLSDHEAANLLQGQLPDGSPRVQLQPTVPMYTWATGRMRPLVTVCAVCPSPASDIFTHRPTRQIWPWRGRWSVCACL